jgi:hypothetical protein
MKKLVIILALVAFLCSCRKAPKVEVEFYDAKIPKIEVEAISVSSIPAISTSSVVKKPKEILTKKECDEFVTVMSKMLYGEAKGVKSKTNQAAVIWCALNRYDSAVKKANGKRVKITQVVTTGAFHGYKKRNPVKSNLKAIVKDVLDRWIREKQGEKSVGRVLPKEYKWFSAYRGYNRFRACYKGSRKAKKYLIPKYSEVYNEKVD